jgi:hypothetical protein
MIGARITVVSDNASPELMQLMESITPARFAGRACAPLRELP